MFSADLSDFEWKVLEAEKTRTEENLGSRERRQGLRRGARSFGSFRLKQRKIIAVLHGKIDGFVPDDVCPEDGSYWKIPLAARTIEKKDFA